VARAIARLSLQYVVMTMVNRDDLLDGGAEHVARTVSRLHALRPDLLIETLVGDFQGHMSAVDMVVDAGPDVFAHNVEVVRRITRVIRDVRSSYDQSLAVLRRAKERQRRLAADAAEAGAPAPRRLTKSSIMVGIGETDDEVLEALRDLREAGVDIVTIGQYLRPSSKHAPVQRFVEPETFAAFERAALEMGFLYAASAPLVRSSYKAAEVFVRSLMDRGGAEQPAGASPGGAPAVEALLEERLAVARREAARLTAELDPDEPRPPVAPATASASPAGLVPAASLVRR
jgi:lipoic acid synthetase